MNGVVLSGSKIHLLRYVRSLEQYPRTPNTGNNYAMQNLLEDSGKYLSALHNIRSLELTTIGIEHVGEGGFRACFSAFRETLTNLSLMAFVTSFSTFVTLVDYFPNITTLRVGFFSVESDEGPVPLLSRPLRGKICLRDINYGSMEFFSRFAKLDLEYEELVLESCLRTTTELLESVLRLGASTVKYLRLMEGVKREYPHGTQTLLYTPT